MKFEFNLYFLVPNIFILKFELIKINLCGIVEFYYVELGYIFL